MSDYTNCPCCGNRERVKPKPKQDRWTEEEKKQMAWYHKTVWLPAFLALPMSNLPGK